VDGLISETFREHWAYSGQDSEGLCTVACEIQINFEIQALRSHQSLTMDPNADVIISIL